MGEFSVFCVAQILFMRNLLAMALLISAGAFAQNFNDRIINPAVPFLTIPSDARASGMGDTGIVTAPDVYSIRWNPAKLAFVPWEQQIGVGYTPYLESVITDINLLSGVYAKRIDDRSAFSLGLRYFTLGEIELRQFASDPGALAKPNEIAVEGAYALQLSPFFSMSVGGRYVRSNLKIPQSTQVDTRAAQTFAVDISAYRQGPWLPKQGHDGRWVWGFNLSNLGPKIAYDSTGESLFIPTNLGVGIGYDWDYGPDSRLSWVFELNKLMVPTPKDLNDDGFVDGTDLSLYQDIDFFSGALRSFGDAPGGIAEELKEVVWSTGLEYVVFQKLAMRAGYLSEHRDKGFRKYVTLGAGFGLKNAQIDLAYLISTAQVRNPLENTLRFSVSFDLSSLGSGAGL